MDKMILLVEDSPEVEALTLSAVRKHVPHVVVIARDGAEALDFLFGTGDYRGRDLSVRPLLVLLDLNLPKVNGLEVLRRIKGDPRTRDIPVVMFTSSAEPTDLLVAYSFGANSYVRKPVDYEEYCGHLKGIMAYWLGLSQSPPAGRDDPVHA